MLGEPNGGQVSQLYGSNNGGSTGTNPLIHARESFDLACVEQRVPLLSPDTIERIAFPFCLPSRYAYLPVTTSLLFIKASKRCVVLRDIQVLAL
ncbi:hypothetical protein BJV78DRAFT_1216457, partial [Lactifluus subvellereus]